MENGDRKDVTVANKSTLRGSDLMLRLLALATTLAAAITLGVDKQTKMVAMTVVPTLPPITVPVTAKWRYLSAFVFFVVANAIACAYSALSLILVLASRGGKKKALSMLVITLDLFMVALLFSSGGAAIAVGLIGYHGNEHVQWNKVCNVFDKFCHQVAGAVAVSMLGAVTFVLLVVLATVNLHRKHQ